MISNFKISLTTIILFMSLKGCTQSNEKAIQFIEATYKSFLMSMDNVKLIDNVIKKTATKEFIKKIYGVYWGREMFICTQDPYEKWIEMIRVIPYHKQKNTYVLSFYDKKLYPNAHKLKIKLIFINGKFKIDNVDCISVK